MNVKGIIGAFLAVIIVLTLFTGSCGAFSVVSGSYHTSDSGSLVPGQEITASIRIAVPENTLVTGDAIYLDSDLTGVSRSYAIYKADGTKVMSVAMEEKPFSPSPYDFVDGFELEYPTDAIVELFIKGKVSSTSSGKSIHVMKISATKAGGDLKEYPTPEQYVYNPGNLNGELAVLGNTITTLDTRIASYKAYERDTSKAQSSVDQARSKYTAAQNAGTANAETAFTNLEQANTLVKQAQMELALTALSMTLSYTTAVDDTITTLYSKGWNTEAKLLDTKNAGLKNTYSQLLGTYNAGNVPDAAALDKLAADSLAVWKGGNDDLESANNPLGGLLNILPFILIGVGVVVVGVVVFLLIRRRRNSWDELG